MCDNLLVLASGISTSFNFKSRNTVNILALLGRLNTQQNGNEEAQRVISLISLLHQQEIDTNNCTEYGLLGASYIPFNL